MKVLEAIKSRLFEKQERIESSNYYDRIDKESIKEYVHAQIERHTEKSYKIRDESFYFDVGSMINVMLTKNIFPQKDHYDMLCLGTRNNHERNCFSRYFSLSSSFVKERMGYDYKITPGNIDETLTKKYSMKKFQKEINEFFLEYNHEMNEIIKKYFYKKPFQD